MNQPVLAADALRARSSRPRKLAAFGVAMAAYTALRIPTFLEPHWYTDEAGYVTTAREMLRGKLLYTGIWSNKPPLQLWTVAVVIHSFGSSEAALHALTYVSGMLTLCAAAYAAFRLLTYPAAVAALAALVMLIGTPLLDAELIVPESLLIGPATWAGAILLARISQIQAPGYRWPAVVGLLSGIAFGFQQTAIADAAAFLLILLLSPKVSTRQLAACVFGFVAVTAAWLIPSLALAGTSAVAYALAGFYVPYTRFQLHGDQSAGIAFGVTLLVSTVMAIVGAVATRRRGWPWAAAVWSVATLLAAGAPLHPYPHLALPAAVPAVVTLAGAIEQARIDLRAVVNVKWAAAPLGAALLIAASVASGTGADWIPALSSQGTNQSRTLTDYYAGFMEAVVGEGSLQSWRSGFNGSVDADLALAEWLRANGLAGSKAVVWSSDAWLYIMADLDDVMPTPPIYNNFALLGYNGEVTMYVAGQDPDVIVTADQDLASFPEISTLLTRRYVEAFSAGGDHVWVRH